MPDLHLFKQKDNKKSVVHGHCLLSFNTGCCILKQYFQITFVPSWLYWRWFIGYETPFQRRNKNNITRAKAVNIILCIMALVYLVYLYFQRKLIFAYAVFHETIFTQYSWNCVRLRCFEIVSLFKILYQIYRYKLSILVPNVRLI